MKVIDFILESAEAIAIAVVGGCCLGFALWAMSWLFSKGAL